MATTKSVLGDHTAGHGHIAVQKVNDRIFCFLTMLALGESERVLMERAVERYADGAHAVLLDWQKRRNRRNP